MNDRDLVAAAAREHAPDWYLTALLAPRATQADLVTAAAFLGEVARIPLVVADPLLAEMRLIWWRDAMSAPDGEATGAPIADAMRDVARRHKLSADLIAQPIEGRIRELALDGTTDEQDFARYLDETEGAALRIFAAIEAPREMARLAPRIAQAAGVLGRVRLARNLGQHLRFGRLPVPTARLTNGDPRALPPDQARTAARAIVAGLSSEARTSLAAIRRTQRSPELRAFLPLALVEPYLHALNGDDFDPLRDVADISPLTRAWRLGIASWRRRI